VGAGFEVLGGLVFMAPADVMTTFYHCNKFEFEYSMAQSNGAESFSSFVNYQIIKFSHQTLLK